VCALSRGEGGSRGGVSCLRTRLRRCVQVRITAIVLLCRAGPWCVCHSTGNIEWYDVDFNSFSGGVTRTVATGVGSPAGLNIGDADGAVAATLLPCRSAGRVPLSVCPTIMLIGCRAIALARSWCRGR
jgi:hypothetical protein